MAFKVFVSGAKTVSSNPSLTTVSTKSGFRISTAALLRLGIVDDKAKDIAENRVVLHINEDAENINEMFGVSKGYIDAKGNSVGAKVAITPTGGTFSFASAWPVMVLADVDTKIADIDDLTRAGLINEKGDYVSANIKTKYAFGDSVTVDIDGNEVEIFYLVDPLKSEVSARGENGEEEDNDDDAPEVIQF